MSRPSLLTASPKPGRIFNTLKAILESLFSFSCPLNTVAVTPGITELFISATASAIDLPVNTTSTPLIRKLSPISTTGVGTLVVIDKNPVASPGESLVIVNSLLTETPIISPLVVAELEDVYVNVFREVTAVTTNVPDAAIPEVIDTITLSPTTRSCMTDVTVTVVPDCV